MTMREPGKHNDQNWWKGFNLWFLLNKINGLQKFEELLDNQRFSDNERNNILRLLKIQGYATILEHTLIAVMDGEWDDFSDNKKAIIRQEVKNRTVKFRSLKRELSPDTEAERLINEQTSSSGKIIITPVLQYVAGYTMGNLIKLAEDHFSVDQQILSKMEEFKDARNYVMHNSTSSREDIDVHFETGLSVAKEIEELLGDALHIVLEKESKVTESAQHREIGGV